MVNQISRACKAVCLNRFCKNPCAHVQGAGASNVGQMNTCSAVLSGGACMLTELGLLPEIARKGVATSRSVDPRQGRTLQPICAFRSMAFVAFLSKPLAEVLEAQCARVLKFADQIRSACRHFSGSQTLRSMTARILHCMQRTNSRLEHLPITAMTRPYDFTTARLTAIAATRRDSSCTNKGWTSDAMTPSMTEC